MSVISIRKPKKKRTVILCAIVAIVAVVAVAVSINGYVEHKRAEEQLRIKDAYVKVNYAFTLTFKAGPEVGFSDGEKKYMSLPPEKYKNAYGMYEHIYVYLKIYENETEDTLPYDMVIDYFSQEYEPDGSLRLYNNGLHPEIEAYVDWAWLRRYWMDKYEDDIYQMYYDYKWEHRDEGFSIDSIAGFSPQMFDELIKKYNDPSYELDLISLQQQGS